MLTQGPAKKIVIYVTEQNKWKGEPTYEAILHFLHKHGCAGATVTKAVAGFGPHRDYHMARLFSFRNDLPMRIEMIESEQKINALLPWIHEMVAEGLIEVQDTEVVKYASQKAHSKQEQPMEHIKLEGQAKMLRIYVGEDDKWEGEPLYDAIIKKLRMIDVAGATVYKGIMGYGANQRVHTSGFFSLSRDLPIMITVVDTEERIRRILPVLDEMVAEGMLVLSDVEVIKYAHTKREPGRDTAGAVSLEDDS